MRDINEWRIGKCATLGLALSIMFAGAAALAQNKPSGAPATTQSTVKTPAPDAAKTDEAPAVSPADAASAAAAQDADFQSLDQEVQGLKKDVVELNKDLFVLEEELLFPANTQIAVFVSMDVGTFFALDSVTLKIDDKEVSNYLYTAREAEALNRGGVHRVYIGNLKVGKHEMVAFFSGKGTHERDYKRGATLNIDKTIGAKYVELQISDRQTKLQPEFVVKEWE